MKNYERKEPKNIIDYDYFFNQVESLVKEKIIKTPFHTYETAKIEGWLGFETKVDDWGNINKAGITLGLLGYYRMNFAIQYKILANVDNRVAIYEPRFVNFFRSSPFKDQVLKNGKVSKELVKSEHFDIIKSQFYHVNSSFNFDEFVINLNK
jgi:hypothetical protein